MAALAPNPTRVRVHTAAPLPSLPPIDHDDRIQATRPPSHVIYPVFDDVHARGIVALTAGVDADGKVRSVRVVRGNPALAAAAIRAIRQWRYRPYIKDGRLVATETNIVISFFSGEAISMSFPPNISVAR
jgi:TonB family protein